MSKEHGADARPVLLIRTISFSFALLLLIALGVFAARMWQTTDVLSKQGSRGNEVRQIQQKLKNWGYYFGEVDGIFGVQTKKAVMDFQRKNGLAVDRDRGQCDPPGHGDLQLPADKRQRRLFGQRHRTAGQYYFGRGAGRTV